MTVGFSVGGGGASKGRLQSCTGNARGAPGWKGGGEPSVFRKKKLKGSQGGNWPKRKRPKNSGKGRQPNYRGRQEEYFSHKLKISRKSRDAKLLTRATKASELINRKRKANMKLKRTRLETDKLFWVPEPV